jgi:Fanconi anemia group M protein
MTEFIEKKYVKKNSIEKRDYQINLANQAIKENCIVVLPKFYQLDLEKLQLLYM